MAAVDWALEQLDWVDKQRLGVTGGSYGGFMTNWIVTQTNRFKAAIADRSISNRHSKFGSADVSYTDGEWEFEGEAYDNPDFYLAHSPITYVRNVQTPLLLQHSEMDLRCPMEQAEQFYIALKKIGKAPVEFVRYPNESHGMSRGGQPKHRKERLEHIVRWFGKYL
jgi:dipeptidyl aminopeptidase/acylaminoacyl peptidase